MIFIRQVTPEDCLITPGGILVESSVKQLFLFSKGNTYVTINYDSDNFKADENLMLELDMNNIKCDKRLKDVKIRLLRTLQVRNKEL